MQQAVDVVEEVLFGDRLARPGGLEVGEAGVGDGVAAARAVAGLAGEQAVIGLLGGFVVEVEGEALSASL